MPNSLSCLTILNVWRDRFDTSPLDALPQYSGSPIPKRKHEHYAHMTMHSCQCIIFLGLHTQHVLWPCLRCTST